jgi:hypothetical protein
MAGDREQAGVRHAMKIRRWARKLESVKTAFREYTCWLVPGTIRRFYLYKPGLFQVPRPHRGEVGRLDLRKVAGVETGQGCDAHVDKHCRE